MIQACIRLSDRVVDFIAHYHDQIRWFPIDPASTALLPLLVASVPGLSRLALRVDVFEVELGSGSRVGRPTCLQVLLP